MENLIEIDDKFLNALARENLADIAKFVTEHNINIRRTDGSTALLIAAQKGDKNLVFQLLKMGAEITVENKEGKGLLALISYRYALDVLSVVAAHQGFIELEQEDIPQITINKLVTSLVYHARRYYHPQVSEKARASEYLTGPALLLLDYLSAIFQNMRNKPFDAKSATLADIEKYIVQEETINRTFYGSYLSDDSDSDEEKEYERMDVGEQRMQDGLGRAFRDRGQMSKMFYSRKQGNYVKGDLKNLDTPSEVFDLNARMEINRTVSAAVKADLEQLNTQLKAGRPISEILAELPNHTQFFIAQYRGVTYQTHIWNKPRRTDHRVFVEANLPQYSAAAFAATDQDFTQYAKISTQPNLMHALQEQADILKETLLSFREPHAFGYAKTTFRNFMCLLQELYSSDYAQFHRFLSTNDELRALLQTHRNFFLSTSDGPYQR